MTESNHYKICVCGHRVYLHDAVPKFICSCNRIYNPSTRQWDLAPGYRELRPAIRKTLGQ